MISNGIANSSVQSWIVQMLFGTTDGNQIAPSVPKSIMASSLVPTPSVKISHDTALAVSALANPPADVDPLGRGLDEKIAEDNKANAVMLSNSKMASADVNAALYDAGVPAVDGDKPTVSFADIVDRERSLGQTRHDYFQNTPELSDYREDEAKEYDENSKFLDQIQTAYNNHTLVFQNASDVAGLDFSRSAVSSSGPGSSSTDAKMSFNRDYYENRPNKDRSRMLDTGVNLTIYLTW